jgi:hypothetical protein
MEDPGFGGPAIVRSGVMAPRQGHAGLIAPRRAGDNPALPRRRPVALALLPRAWSKEEIAAMTSTTRRSLAFACAALLAVILLPRDGVAPAQDRLAPASRGEDVFVGAKYSAGDLRDWLRDPASVRPTAHMRAADRAQEIRR